MKGATALDSVNTISAPNKTRIMIIGNNQNFFLTFINPQNSLNSPITFPPYIMIMIVIVIPDYSDLIEYDYID